MCPKEIDMNAQDVMSSPAITVTSRASVRDITSLLREHRISAVPVVDNGELVGMVTACDLLDRKSTRLNSSH